MARIIIPINRIHRPQGDSGEDAPTSATALTLWLGGDRKLGRMRRCGCDAGYRPVPCVLGTMAVISGDVGLWVVEEGGQGPEHTLHPSRFTLHAVRAPPSRAGGRRVTGLNTQSCPPLLRSLVLSFSRPHVLTVSRPHGLTSSR
jgi:hypothetical protein